MEDIIDYKLDLSEGYEYFFNFLSDRFEYTNNIWVEALKKRFNKKFKPIWILSAKQNDLFMSNKENYIIINKKLKEIKQKLKKNNIIYLEDYEDLNQEFSESRFVKNLIDKLANKQRKVFILGFTSACLNLRDDRVIILGPNPEITNQFDNKVEHIRLFEKLDLPRNRTRVYNSINEIKANEKYPFYISASYTSGGHESGTIYTEEDLELFFSKLRELNRLNSLLVADLITDIKISPNVNAIICGSKDTRIICISDQILRGNKYLGNIYPSTASENENKIIIETTNKIGDFLSNLGFRGLFGLDFIIDSNGKVYCVDLNPRRQGGYLCNILMSKKVNIPEIELRLALGEKLPEFDYQDFQASFVWAHSKVKPYFSNTRITNCFKIGEAILPFSNIGSEYKAIFYPTKHILADGNAGYIIVSSNSYEEVKERIIKETEILISKNFELYEGL